MAKPANPQAESQLISLDGETVAIESHALNPRPAAQSHRSGEIIDQKYQITTLLGQGGMGAVYKAHHLMLDKEVALKTFRSPNLTGDSWKRFQREAQTIARFSHQNIVLVYDFGVGEDNIPYYTMECLEGQSLADRLNDQGTLSIDQTMEIFLQVSRGLALAHGKGIIHRDLKPANIFLIRQGPNKKHSIQVKIVDFGIAGLANESMEAQRLTAAGTIFGSPLYMSPEQSLGEEVTASSDIYSCGCALFETLTGSPPFRGDNALATMMQHQQKAAPLLSDQAGETEFPQRLVNLVARMLAKSKDERIQSFDEIIAEIEKIQQGRKSKQHVSEKLPDGAAKPEGLIKKAESAEDPDGKIIAPPGQSRWLTLAALAITLSLVCLAGYYLLNASHTAAVPTETPAQESSLKVEAVNVPHYLQNPDHGIDKSRRFIFPKSEPLGTLNFTCVGPHGKLQPCPEPTPARGEVVVPPYYRIIFKAKKPPAVDPQLFAGFYANDLSELTLDDSQKDEWCDKHMAYIGNLTGLTSLNINSSRISGKSLPALNNLRHLKTLYVRSTALDGTDIAKLEMLPRLTQLVASSTRSASAFLPLLAGHDLKTLAVADCDLQNQDISTISKITKLGSLDLEHNTTIDDGCLQYIAGMKQLTDLNICGTSISKKIIPILKDLPHLEIFTVGVREWDKEAIEAFRHARPSCNLIVRDNSQHATEAKINKAKNAIQAFDGLMDQPDLPQTTKTSPSSK